jgi:integrase
MDSVDVFRAPFRVLEPASIQKLIDSAGSDRDKAILILLSRAAQRIAIGVQLLAGMGFWAWSWRMLIARGALSQCGRRGRAISTACPSPTTSGRFTNSTCAPSARRRRMFTPFWIASRKGQRKPIRYASFELAPRYIGRRTGISVHLHLFRHTLTQGVLETTGSIKVAQEILGHSHLSTTADL